MIKIIIKELRLHQWSKNVLLFVPVLLSRSYDNFQSVLLISTAFLIFSAIASGTYVLNDIIDLENDRKHPSKKERPLASGELTLFAGIILFLLLTISGLISAYLLSNDFFLVCLLYIVTTLFYTFWLKVFIIVDAIVLAALYTLRLIAGGAVVDIELSFWLLAFSMFFFISLALLKRCTELELVINRKGSSLDGRNYLAVDLEMLKTMGLVSGYLSILVVALYINSREVLMIYENPDYLWIICPILLYWISRMWVKTNRQEMHDDPIVFAIKDKTSYLSAVLISATLILAY